MISVCMATYNGSKYIEYQLESILIQLNEGDEIVVVDDASTDNTVQLVENIKDSRIKLFKNHKNLGVIRSFSKSICLSKGELIFLSDQDDIWLPGKVDKIVSVFVNKLDVTLCLTDSKIIDDHGTLGNKTYFQLRGGFSSSLLSNIVKNKFLGCSIAFRSSMVGNILPFPKNIPSHDMWIGLINTIYGKIDYIDEPLFLYRRHSENVSSMSHEKVHTMIKWRLIVIYRLFQRIFLFSNNKNNKNNKI